MRYFLLALLVLTASPAYAAVSIHEVAWMGSTASANHEWIELYNSGTDEVTVDGWTLSDGMNFNITLTGSISGGGYAVLERTSEASSVAPAFLIYTGALVNTGATLTLRDAGAAVVDQVAGGADWKNIGGDNTTKETAQYQTTGWVTDVATPGQANGGGRVEETPVVENTPEATPTTTATGNPSGGVKSRSNKSSDSIRLKNPEVKLTVLPDVQAVAYTHQTVPFNVKTGGVDENLEKLVRYEWNFGDSYTGTGKNPEHVYAYPGTYVVTVRAEYKKNVQVARHEITILPVNFSLTRNSAGDVQIHNDAAYDVDVSGYTVRGTKAVTFPPRTIIASRSTITVAGERVQQSHNELIGLYDTRREVVTTSVPPNALAGVLSTDNTDETIRSVAQGIPAIAPLIPATLTPGGFGFELIAEAQAATPPQAEELIIGPSDVGSSPMRPTNNRMMYLVLIGVLLLAVASLLLPKTKPVETL